MNVLPIRTEEWSWHKKWMIHNISLMRLICFSNCVEKWEDQLVAGELHPALNSEVEPFPTHRLLSTQPPWKHNMGSSLLFTIDGPPAWFIHERRGAWMPELPNLFEGRADQFPPALEVYKKSPPVKMSSWCSNLNPVNLASRWRADLIAWPVVTSFRTNAFTYSVCFL